MDKPVCFGRLLTVKVCPSACSTYGCCVLLTPFLQFPLYFHPCANTVSRSTATMIMCAGRAHPAALHPAAAASMIIECAGCAKPILDKFLLNVLERTWHAECVRCYDCRGNLTDKCFSREGKLFCRNDFFR